MLIEVHLLLSFTTSLVSILCLFLQSDDLMRMISVQSHADCHLDVGLFEQETLSIEHSGAKPSAYD